MREESGSHNVTRMPHQQLMTILTSFGLFNVISCGNDLSELWE